MWSSIFGALSPAGDRARLSTLIFHRVLPQPDPLFPEEIDAVRFDAICGWVRQWFNVLPLDDAVRRLRNRSLPARAMAISFDDGYEDNASVAVPILQRHGLSATFFVATGFLDGGRMWNDSLIEAIRRTTITTLDLTDVVGVNYGAFELNGAASRRAAIDALLPKVKYLAMQDRLDFCADLAQRCKLSLPNDLMMCSEQVRDLHRMGMQIGAHTMNHPILARLTESDALGEIAGSKQRLEEVIDASVRLFAYPNGQPGDDYDKHTVALVQACGFEAAMVTTWGAAHARSDLYQLPRFTPWDQARMRFGMRLASNLARRPQ